MNEELLTRLTVLLDRCISQLKLQATGILDATYDAAKFKDCIVVIREIEKIRKEIHENYR